MAHVCASERPQLPSLTSSSSIKSSPSLRKSWPPNTPGRSPHIVTNKKPIPLIRNNFVSRKLEVGLAPGKLVLGKPAARIMNNHLMRQLPAPVPKHQIVIGRCGTMSEAWRNHSGVALVDEPLRDFPRWRLPAFDDKGEPCAGHIVVADTMLGSVFVRSQISNI